MVIAIYRVTTGKPLVVISSVDIQREKYSLSSIAINFFRLKFAERSQRKTTAQEIKLGESIKIRTTIKLQENH